MMKTMREHESPFPGYHEDFIDDMPAPTCRVSMVFVPS